MQKSARERQYARPLPVAVLGWNACHVPLVRVRLYERRQHIGVGKFHWFPAADEFPVLFLLVHESQRHPELEDFCPSTCSGCSLL